MSRIRMSLRYGETPANVFSDFAWIRQNERELLAKYGECNILVYQQQVIGFGNNYQEAVDNAEQNITVGDEEITPVHQWLRERSQRIGILRKISANQ